MAPRRMTYPQFKSYSNAASKIQAVVRRKKATKLTKNLKLNKPVAKLVDRKIDSKIQTLHAAYHQRRFQFSNLIADNPITRLHEVIPNVVQGVERDDRSSSTIRLLTCNIKGRIDIPADDNPYFGPPPLPQPNEDRAQIYVRLMCMSAKAAVPIEELTDNWATFYNDRFFKNEATPFSPTGQYLDMLSVINRDVFTVHYDKVYKMDRNLGYYPDLTSTSGAAPQKPVSKEFNINVKCKNKLLRYSVPGAAQSQNFRPFVCCLFCYGNAAAPSTVEVPFIEYLSKITYKD